ncbi:MAG TPA: hypothetical protein DCR35_20730 [Runella sp.]|nr:hypothetical protein [Runella sp.]HAO51527.1 hypothetical protein [Runella sp.]
MKRKPLHQQLSSSLSMAIGLAYLGGGLYLVASSATFGVLPSGALRYLFGAMLIVYGGYRFYRGYSLYKSENE